MNEERYSSIKALIKDLPNEDAIKRLEEAIWIEEMADFADFELIEIYQKIIKELKGHSS